MDSNKKLNITIEFSHSVKKRTLNTCKMYRRTVNILIIYTDRYIISFSTGLDDPKKKNKLFNLNDNP